MSIADKLKELVKDDGRLTVLSMVAGISKRRLIELSKGAEPTRLEESTLEALAEM